MKLVMVNESDLETMADWWGSQPNVAQSVLDIVEKFVATPPGGEILQVWTEDDVELVYENVQSDYESDYEATEGATDRPPPWTELSESERSVLVQAGRKALEHTASTCDALYDAVDHAMMEMTLVGGKL